MFGLSFKRKAPAAVPAATYAPYATHGHWGDWYVVARVDERRQAMNPDEAEALAHDLLRNALFVRLLRAGLEESVAQASAAQLPRQARLQLHPQSGRTS